MPAARPVARSSSPPLPALPIAPIVPNVPPVDVVYHPCVVAQHTSTDLVIYTRDLGRVITIAYPLSPLGIRIVPSGIFRWMERRGLVFECFCALVSSQPTPARFIDEFHSGHTVVRCHYIDNRCGYYLDLTKIHAMTMYESSYEHLLTLTFGAPDIRDILARWYRLVRQDVALLQHPAPFVRGYFTIHVSLYPGVQQLRSGLLQPHTPPIPRHRALYHPYHHQRATFTNNEVASLRSHQLPRHQASRHSPSVSGPSTSTGLFRHTFSERETEALDALKMGFGVSRNEIEDLFEQCDHCGQSFMRSALRTHIKQQGEMEQGEEQR